MGVRGVLAAVVGVIQSVIGVLAIAFAYVLNYNTDVQAFVQTMLGMKDTPIEEVLPVFLLIIITFGFFSIISGLLLTHEWRKTR